jgi:hypothetical protein
MASSPIECWDYGTPVFDAEERETNREAHDYGPEDMGPISYTRYELPPLAHGPIGNRLQGVTCGWWWCCW